ncbi:TIGR03089 family protein [Rhodococcus sp. 06-412-2C]|uniref:TIGR03089 family protein n=1 Tax=unclassified Rhodococcus (in: high G+C Gram-positive bacteria) TaxID=192944 RepID=UPI000B9ACB77|nr:MULTISPECIES: TIGR03089 family protein [unclassified Rhodococcus (in: high G+C Gram-positive bacteria)]OZC93490.1 TIGR03089 family protein [Rhodococcus sp. 06-412-2C]OZC95409.1 TIGR03089 family protein [Rhodococcus sp. 06-412-2B]
MASNLTQTLLDPILAADPAGPRITFYDDATGERVEVSAVTLANWAAKTANLLRDEFAFEVGGKVSVLLPAHWQTAAVLLGAWWAGGEVVLGADDSADVAMVSADRLAEAPDVDEVLAFSLDAFGKAVPDLPIGMTDYATSVRVHGDQFRTSGGATGAAALDGRSVDEVLAAARAAAETRSWTAADRVLSTASWNTPDEIIEGLLSVLVAGASLVQVTNADEAKSERRTETEKVTATLT